MKKLLLNILLIPIFCIDVIILILTFGAYCENIKRTRKWLENYKI